MRIFVVHPIVLALLAGCAAEPDAATWGTPADALGWTPRDGVSDLPPPPVSVLTVDFGLMAGASSRLSVQGAPPGAGVSFLGTRAGTGAGPCHPQDPGVCVDLLQPRVLGTDVANAAGVARWTLDIPDGFDGPVAFQAYVDDGGFSELTDPVEDAIASVSHGWDLDTLDVVIAYGESGYTFGMAETDSPNGWFGEDCLYGQYGYDLCHPIATDGVILDSVHQDVGGAGIAAVVPGASTLFYDVHDPAITYLLIGDDSGDCWVWGDDPTYYDALGCASL